MRAIRQRISRLKTKLEESLLDENDLFGYSGINKQGLINSLTNSYELLLPLEEFNNEFETILAKRNVTDCINKVNTFINEDLNSDQVTTKFNDCINSIGQIRFIIRDTYIALTEKPLRIDSELAQAKKLLIDITSDLENIKEVKNEIDNIKENSENFTKELEKIHTNSIENELKINGFVKSIETIDDNISGTNEKITLWKSEIQTINEDISAKQTAFTKLKTEIEQLQEQNIENKSEIEQQELTLKDQLEKNKLHQETIQKTIEDVSRYGMAGSFKKRKDELKWTQRTWAALTILALLILIGGSYYLIEPFIESDTLNINHLLYKIPVFASCV